MALTLTSPAFGDNEKIPLRYSGDGEDISPPLSWDGIPQGAAELILICDDPNAPTPQPWVHWVIYGLEPALKGLPEAIPTDKDLQKPVKARQGVNSWGRIGYGGPAPPHGHGVHHYQFTLYALDKRLDLKPGLNKDTVLNAIKGATLEQAILTGTYQR